MDYPHPTSPSRIRTRSAIRRLSHTPTPRITREVDRLMRRVTALQRGPIEFSLLGRRRSHRFQVEGETFIVGRRRIRAHDLRRSCYAALSRQRLSLSELTAVVENSSVIAALLCALFPDTFHAKREGRSLWLHISVTVERVVAEQGCSAYRVMVKPGKPAQLALDFEPPLTQRTLLYHVMDGGSNLAGWDLSNRPIPTLISLAHYSDRRNSLQTDRALDIIRAKCAPLMLDSGRLTWMRKGLAEYARMDLTPRLLEAGTRLGADVIVAGDVPMEPQILSRVALQPREALEITWRANRALQAAPWERIRGYVIQGFEEQSYLESVAVAMASGQAEEVMAGRAIWVIGSVCMAPADKVYRVAELLQERLPGPKHFLGQGRPSVIRHLRSMGITWADSGTAAGYAARGKWLYCSPAGGDFHWRRLHDGRPLSPQTYGLLVRNNIEVMELALAHHDRREAAGW